MRWLSFLLLPVAVSAQFWLAGEALLLRPTIYRPYTAIFAPAIGAVTAPPLSGRWVGGTKPGYDWGYRIELGYRRCCLDARVNWSSWIHTDPFSLSADASQRIWFTFMHPSGADDFISPGQLLRRDQYRAQAIDGEFGYSMARTCSPFTMRSYVGVRYARIRYNVNVDAAGTDAGSGSLLVTDRWESDVQGTGPRGGIDVCYRLPWHLRLFGDASLALLLSTAKGRYLDFLNDGGVLRLTADRMSSANLMILNPEARFGLGCCWDICSFALDLQVGYQISYLSMGVIRAQFVDFFADGVSAVTRDPFALDGWNFRLGVGY